MRAGVGVLVVPVLNFVARCAAWAYIGGAAAWVYTRRFL